jgi:hypothetical protein
MSRKQFIVRYSISQRGKMLLGGLREGWVLAMIQYHKGEWEIIKLYDDPPRIPARVDPWKRNFIEQRGRELEKLSPKALRVKDDK